MVGRTQGRRMCRGSEKKKKVDRRGRSKEKGIFSQFSEGRKKRRWTRMGQWEGGIDGKKDKWTAKQKGTCGQSEGVVVRRWGQLAEEGGGVANAGIKQPRHRIVKGKVLLLRPPVDPRLELIEFKGELFGHLQRHVLPLLAWEDRRRLPPFTICCVPGLRKRGVAPRVYQAIFTDKLPHRSANFLYCDCIELSNQSQEKGFLDWLVLILSQ